METLQPLKSDASTSQGKSQAARPLTIGRSEQGALGAVATLGVVEERVAMLFSPQLEAILQSDLSITAAPTQLMKWSEAEAMLEDPGCYALMEVEGMGGHAIVSIDHGLFFGMLEKLFGGGKQGGGGASARSRLSAIETRVFKKVLRVFAQSMEQAWKPILPIHMNTLRVDTRTTNVAVTSADDAVVFETYEVSMDGLTGAVHVIIPKVTMWRFKDQLSSGRYDVTMEPEKESRTKIEHALREVELHLTAELGRTYMRLEQLAALAPGDVLRLDRSPDMPTVVQVNGQPKYLARTTVSHGNLAVELEAAIFPTQTSLQEPH